MGVAAVSPVFVGRRGELASLAGEVRRAAAGEAGFVLVGGEAGIGKTRLVEEAAGAATRAGMRVLSGRCVELGPEGLPLAPLAPLVEALRMLARSATPGQVDGWLGSARGELARLLPSLDPTGESAVSGAGQAAQLPELVLGVIERVSASAPVLFVVEDLHWADQSTLGLVAHLVRTLRDVPVLLVATYRSDEIHRRHPLRPLLSGWERARTIRRLELARFDREEVAAQVAAILGRPVDGPLVDLVLDRSEGNAFLVEEVVGVVRDGSAATDLSASLRDVLLVRVEARSATGQRVLRAASAGGRRVPERLLTAVLGMEPAALLDALRELVENHLLVVDETGQGYAFRHALARDAVYGDMLPGERVGWHVAYGTALSAAPELAAADAAVHAELALHWFRALDLPAALPAFLAAAARSSAYAPAEQLRHLERALEIWPRVPQAADLTGTDAVEVLRAAADAAIRAGSIDRALSLLDQALADLGETGSVSRRALLLERRGRALRDLGQEADSVVVLRQAQQLLPATPVTAAHAVVLTSLANSLMRAGDLAEANVTAEQAAEVAASVGAQAEEAEARVSQGAARGYLGDPESGLVILREGLQLAQRLGATETVLRGHVNHSDMLEMLGRHQEAIDAASAGLDLARRVGAGRTTGTYLAGNIVEPLVRLGRWPEAERAAVEAQRGEPEGVFAAILLDMRAQLAVLAGRHEDAERLADQAGRLMGASRDPQFRESIAFSLAEARRLTGDLDAAAAIVAQALSEDDPTRGLHGRYSWPLVWLGTRIAADRAALARDRRASVADDGFADNLATIARQLPTLTPQGRGYAAMTAAERDRLSQTNSTDAWSGAVDAWRAALEPYPLAYCLLRWSEDLYATGARQPAAVALREAAALAAQLGAAPISHEAEAFARRARVPLTDPTGNSDAGAAASAEADPASSARSQPADALAPFHLTEREREVLELLAEGRSNPQIATALFISPKTASVHVSNILAKLSVTGRVEAAALVHRLARAQG
ncbi:MAG: helix-turn-helix transcriptional regulator [Frankia sp.]